MSKYKYDRPPRDEEHRALIAFTVMATLVTVTAGLLTALIHRLDITILFVILLITLTTTTIIVDLHNYKDRH